MELYKSKILQKGITQTLLKGNYSLLSRTSNFIYQKRLRSDLCNIKNDSKLILTSPLNLNNVSIKREFTRGLNDGVIGKKNNEMWKEYRAIDSRVIRPIDTNELFITNAYLNATDVFPKISTEEFKKRAEKNFPKIELFNIAFKKINGHLFFIHKPFKLYLKEVEYTEDEEIENFLKTKDKMIIPYEPIQVEDDKDVQALISFKICQLKKSNQTKITVLISHSICDGRTIFTIMDYVRKIINGENLERNDEKLSNFCGLERFKNLDKSFYESPKSWNEIPYVPLLPKMKPPFKHVSPHIIFDYKPISKFCHENGISLQAMVMAAITRAARRYNNLSRETPIWISIPSDLRSSPYATEEYKKCQLYCNVGIMYVKLIGQSNLMEDLKHCMAQLKEAKESNDNVRQVVCCTTILDHKTLAFIPSVKFPSQDAQAIINCTNIGKVSGTFPLLTPSYDPNVRVFTPFMYYTEDKLFLVIYRPYNFDQTYIDIIEEEINKVFIPENISKY